MRKIRIGNDIRLKLKIVKNELANNDIDKIDEFDQSSVKQLRCYLINTCFCGCCGDKPHLKPFLRVGFPEFYRPTHNNINNAGFPSYHMRPANLCNYDRFEPDFHDFHWWPGYRGFGLHPEHFHDHCCHIQHGPRPKPSCCGFECWEPWHDCCHHCEPHFPSCAEPYHPVPEPYDIYGRPVEDHRHPDPYLPYYLADSQVLNEKNTITCMFPAVQQKLCGIYKLVVVLTVFEQGWGRHNLRTYTIDKGDVFELVGNEKGESGAITIDVDDSGKRENVFEGIYTKHPSYTMTTNNQLKIGEQDMNGREYDIYVSLKDGSTISYNPYDWRYNQLVFEFPEDDCLTIGKDGTLYTSDMEEGAKTITITVRDIDSNVFGEFDLTIKAPGAIKMGFSELSSHESVSPEDSFLNDYRVKEGVYKINNPSDGKYLWIFTQNKIKYINSVDGEEGDDKISIQLSSGIRVPLTDYTVNSGYYCYRSAAPIRAGWMYTKIRFA